MIECVSKTDAMVMCAGHDGLAYAIFKMKPEDVLPYTIATDGTLTVTVPKGTKRIDRILIEEDGTQYGGLFYPDTGGCFLSSMEDVNENIKSLESADVAPVVRCKDCKLRRVDGYCTKFQNNILGIAASWFVPEDDGFCSYGKPREE